MLRFTAALATALLALAAFVGVPAPAGAAVVAPCSNYDCPDPTGWASARWYAHAGYPSFGGTVNGANCTNYVAWRLMRTVGMPEGSLGGLGNANTWDTRAASKGYTVDKKPSVGAVAQWDSNHVSYVEQVNSDGTIVISESNVWIGTTSNRMWLHHRVIKASSVDHFIHFRPSGVPKNILATSDFNGDGMSDVIAQLTSGELRLYRGNNAGGFLIPGGARIGTGWSSLKLIAPGDFNGDRKADLIGVALDGKMYLYRGNGTGGFIGSRVYFSGGWQIMRLVFSSGDFDGDKLADVLAVRPDGTLALYPGNGKGGWKAKAVTIGSGFETAVQVAAPGDLDGDGKADIVALWPDGSVTLYAGAGTAALPATGTPIASGWTDATILAGRGDVTGDGKTDVLAVRGGTGLFVYAGGDAVLPATGVQPGVLW